MNIPESTLNGDGVIKPRIILAVRDAKRKEAYLSALDALAECTVIESLGGIPDLLRQSHYNGILIDINLNVKATYMEKVKISDSLDTMPSATLNFNARQGLMHLLMLDKKHGSASNLEEFTTLCATFQPEVLYPHNQNALHLNALLSPVQDFGQDAEHTFTMYVSGGGCFLFTANKSGYQPQDTVWIDFVGLSARNPIMGKVCWKCEWGVSHSVPGIYISFESILESQHEEIMNLLDLKRN